MSNNHNSVQLKLVNNQFLLKKKISQGSFGVVYAGEEINSRVLVAIKVEKEFHEDSSLDREAEILRRLQKIPQVPKLFFAGREGDSNVLVIQYLGRDLTHYLKTFRKFSLKCVITIAEQMITTLENIHKNKVIHRDIKPENILCGKEDESHLLYTVDYGISKFYKDDNDSHISFRENQPFIGTTRYASISAHKGHSISRKDDLESLGYMLIFLLKGQLPWQNLQFTSEEDKIKQVGQMKMKLDINELCKGIPIEFGRFIEYVRGLPFKAEPNYKYCCQLFRKIANEHKYTPTELVFDWNVNTGSRQEISNRKIQQQNDQRPSLFQRKRNEEHSSSQLQGSSIQDVEMNSLLRTPDQKKSSLTPEIRRKSRMVSVSSYNSNSNFDYNNSVMLAIQPSMMSRLSKLSFNSNSGRSSHKKKQKSNLVINQTPQFDKILGNKQQKTTRHPIDNETITDFSRMNDGDEYQSLDYKYNELKGKSVQARFKKQIIQSYSH